MSPIIKVEELSVWYEKGKPSEIQALKNISLEIEKGDYVAFFGPSGSGKTTLLYAIAGIDRFQDGHVYIHGRDLTGLSNRELAIFRQTGIGIVFQQFNLVPTLSVLQNVALPMAFIGISGDKAQWEAQKLLDRLGIGNLRDRLPSELSGGQQQRAGIARALANNPPIIIADEPLGNLDSANAKNVLAFLKELNEKDGRTIIMVTHEAWSLQDTKTIFYIKDGVVTDVAHETPGSVADAVTEHLRRELASEKADAPEQIEPSILSARLLANFMMRGYSLDEVRRFEQLLNQRLKGEIDAKAFLDTIDKPFKQGGVGLWKGKAIRIASLVEQVIDKHHDVEAIERIIIEHPELPIDEEVRRIRQWLLTEPELSLSDSRLAALDQCIADRLRGYIDSRQFNEVLNMAEKKNGVGLSFRSAERIMEKMDAILTGGEDPAAPKPQR